MAIDLRKNKDSITQAYEKVINDKDDTDWALFGYEGQTPVLKVLGSGNGGFEELTEELSSGKMLYAYCKVKDPNSGLFKYVLIHWTGESVPENLKLKYTSHLKDVQNLLKSIHVTIPARCEQDIDADDIIKKVAKSSGANYSFHKEQAKPAEPSGPVGTDYRRVVPTKEININARDKFWAQAEKEEIERQNREKLRLEEERKKAEEERKEREIRETREREKRISEHSKEVSKLRQAEKRADDDNNKEVEQKRWEQMVKESSIDEDERGHRSDQLRKERVSEATQLASSTTSNARDFFKQKSVERPLATQKAPPPPKKIRGGFLENENNSDSAPLRREPIKLPTKDEPATKPPRQPEPLRQPEPVRQPEPEPETYSSYSQEDSSEPVSSPVLAQTPDLLRSNLPPRQDSDNEEDNEQDWDEPPAEDFEFREKRVPSYHEDYSAETHHADTQSHRISGAQHFEEQEEEQQPEVPSSFSITPEMGKCARALYDYQASDDTEISFDPDQIISNIAEIDDGWWQGFAPNGSYGMFPANYVELIN